MTKKGSGKTDYQSEIDTLKNQVARALADYDNLRKRVERERLEIEIITLSKLVARFIPLLDNLDHVQEHLKDPGLAIAIKEFQDSLKDEGIEAVVPQKGEVFDESAHEAVELVSEETLEENAIAEVILPGWKTREGFVIRPAKVKVNSSQIKSEIN